MYPQNSACTETFGSESRHVEHSGNADSSSEYPEFAGREGMLVATFALHKKINKWKIAMVCLVNRSCLKEGKMKRGMEKMFSKRKLNLEMGYHRVSILANKHYTSWQKAITRCLFTNRKMHSRLPLLHVRR